MSSKGEQQHAAFSSERDALLSSTKRGSFLEDEERQRANNSSGWQQAWAVILGERRRNEPQEENTNRTPRKNQFLALMFGQIIALLASSMNASSFTLNYHYGVHTFLFQMIWVYLLLSMNMLLVKDNEEESFHPLPGTSLKLRIPWYHYLMISLMDVLPNLMTLVSFSYTSLTSSTLLGSVTVPSTIFFSRIILGRVFQRRHWIGALLCVLGGCLTVWTDSSETNGNSTRTDQSYVGDFLAVISSLLYGLGDTIAEYSIKHVDRHEYLGMIGIFGCFFSVVAVSLLEVEAVQELYETATTSTDGFVVAAIMLWYVASVVLYYLAEAKFLISSDATLLNLSMQTTNGYAILFAWIVYGETPETRFYLAVVLVVVGAFYYELGGDNITACICGKPGPEAVAASRPNLASIL